MNVIELSINEIDDLCRLLALRVERNFWQYSVHVNLMFRYGLRIGETFLSDGLLKGQNSELIVTMPKTGFTRIIEADEFTERLNIDNLLALNSLQYINVVNLSRILKQVSPYRNLFTGTKPINSHIFRHNYAKQLFQEYNDIDVVHYRLSEQEVKSTENYINSKIYYYG